MRVLSSGKQQTLHHIKNEEISQELQTQPIIEQAKKYKDNWKEHVMWMSLERIPRKCATKIL